MEWNRLRRTCLNVKSFAVCIYADICYSIHFTIFFRIRLCCRFVIIVKTIWICGDCWIQCLTFRFDNETRTKGVYTAWGSGVGKHVWKKPDRNVFKTGNRSLEIDPTDSMLLPTRLPCFPWTHRNWWLTWRISEQLG